MSVGTAQSAKVTTSCMTKLRVPVKVRSPPLRHRVQTIWGLPRLQHVDTGAFSQQYEADHSPSSSSEANETSSFATNAHT
jgi:hypothetical protein